MKTALHIGDVVTVRQGRAIVRGRVIETYESHLGSGHRAVIEVPETHETDVEPSTYSYDVEALELAA